jgi:RecA-family ATPase
MTDNPSSQRPQIIEQLRAEIRGVSYRPATRKKNERTPPPNPQDARYVFTIGTGNRWMELGSRQPPAKMLFGQFWYEHEICFLFANTNTGKSVLAVQIGKAIANGGKTGPFACQVKATQVIYADFELSTLQFHQRYSDSKQDYNFPDNFYRAEFNADRDLSDDMGGATGYRDDEWLIAGIEYRIQQLNATVLIVDNISCLSGGTGNAAGALRIMKQLHALRTTYKISILVLAHVSKSRYQGRPLSVDDLHGSKLLINFADSAFTIGVSNSDSSQRYLKQIKQRNTQQVYGDQNVCLCRIQKRTNCLQFEFEGNSAERPHLLSRAQAQSELLTEQVKALSADGFSQRQISQELKIGLAKVNKLLNK